MRRLLICIFLSKNSLKIGLFCFYFGFIRLYKICKEKLMNLDYNHLLKEINEKKVYFSKFTKQFKNELLYL